MEGKINPLADLSLIYRFPINKVRSVPVYDGVEGQTVPPGPGKVVHFDTGVAMRRFLGPP
jgi:hypothetical protein